MVKPNQRVLERLAYLSTDREFVDWLTASLESYRDDTVMLRDETPLRQAQGKAQVVKELLAAIIAAPDTLTKNRRA